MNRLSLIPAALAVAVATAGMALWLFPPRGREAPAVVLPTLAGQRIELASLEGRPVMLQFWATTCRTCVAEMPHLKDLHQDLARHGLKLIAVAMPYDPPDQVAAMARQKDLPYTVALDRDGQVTGAFGDIRVTPTTVLIDSQGHIAWMRRGKLDFDRLSDDIGERLNTNEAG